METKEKNLCAKTRKVDEPYEIWKGYNPYVGKVEYRVLKKYQKPSLEAKNKYARWFVAARSEATYGSWEYGDNYVNDIKSFCKKVESNYI